MPPKGPTNELPDGRDYPDPCAKDAIYSKPDPIIKEIHQGLNLEVYVVNSFGLDELVKNGVLTPAQRKLEPHVEPNSSDPANMRPGQVASNGESLAVVVVYNGEPRRIYSGSYMNEYAGPEVPKNKRKEPPSAISLDVTVHVGDKAGPDVPVIDISDRTQRPPVLTLSDNGLPKPQEIDAMRKALAGFMPAIHLREEKARLAHAVKEAANPKHKPAEIPQEGPTPPKLPARLITPTTPGTGREGHSP